MSTNWIGLIGTTLVVIAYLPQISHLVRNQCSAGISLKAYAMWLVSSLMLFFHAFSINDPVFIALQSYQLGATTTIVFFTNKYKDSVCPLHRHPSAN
jgi:uncharacterized protein with PQ loop repeat